MLNIKFIILNYNIQIKYNLKILRMHISMNIMNPYIVSIFIRFYSSFNLIICIFKNIKIANINYTLWLVNAVEFVAQGSKK